MADVENPSTIRPDVMAEMEEVRRLVPEAKRVTDPELLQRVRGRSEAVRREIFEKYGVVEWAVHLIREGRDEE
jgi:hypothetical protein